jgi:hypothetical protein
VRSQRRLWRLPLIALEDLLVATRAHWMRGTRLPRRIA